MILLNKPDAGTKSKQYDHSIWTTSTKLCIALALVIEVTTLTCLSSSPLKDYSTGRVSCVSSCPSGSELINSSLCLGPSQYLIGAEVHLCESTHISPDRTLCCSNNEFVFTQNGVSECLKCNGEAYQSGNVCCSSNEYMNFAAGLPQCTKIGTGQCASSIKFSSKIKVCCPSSQPFYNIALQSCISSGSQLNCDPTETQICCPSNQRLEYISGQFQCVSICKWAPLTSNSFSCSEKFCNANLLVLPAGPSYRDLYNLTEHSENNEFLLATNNGQCCYGMSATSSECFRTEIDCGKRFFNRGWTLCCPHGTYYSLVSRTCVTECPSGNIIVLSMICLQEGRYLNLATAAGTAPQQTTSSLCNGRTLHRSSPICCPLNFSLDYTNGCVHCSGTIHKTGTQQVCCSEHEYYDTDDQICKNCEGGAIDASGTLCCFEDQYVQYSTSGVASCMPTCAEDFVYNTQFCCLSLGQSSCQSRNFIPNHCSSNYYVPDSCQGCPRFCSNIATCSVSGSNLTTCTKICPSNFILFADINECLSCDPACSGCSAPFDRNFCTACADGYAFQNNECQKCSIQCKTCASNDISLCTSCFEDGPKPFLSNGQCTFLCDTGNYLTINSTTNSSQCEPCNFNCVECEGSLANQCLKCQPASFLSSSFMGVCGQCSSLCRECFRGSASCISCTSTAKYYLNTQICATSCQQNEVSISLEDSSHQICLPCHPQCASCQLTPENCLTCLSNTQYVDRTLGISLCVECVEPCRFCSSKQNCSTCIDGYYLNSQTLKCLPCFKQCMTCFNESQNGCLTCYGDSQIVGGRCVGCSDRCQRCDQNENCLDCNQPYYLYQASCLVDCPDGTYPNSTSRKCTNCYSQCQTCTNGSENGCLSCSESSSQIQLIDGRCVGCSQNCQTCNSNLVCTECSSNLVLYQSNCLTSCPTGTFQNSNSQCSNCSSTCSACASASACTVCLSAFPILFNGRCLSSCPLGFKVASNGVECQVDDTDDNNNTNNNTDNNNTDDNGSVVSLGSKIRSQTFIFKDGVSMGLLSLYFQNATLEQITQIAETIKFFLINLGTREAVEIETNIKSINVDSQSATLRVGPFPSFSGFDAALTELQQSSTSASQSVQTSLKQNPFMVGESTDNVTYEHVSSRIFTQLVVQENQTSSLNSLKVLSIVISVVLLAALVLSKLKSHFLAQQANTLILHLVNWAQVLFIFKYLTLFQDKDGLFGFFEGFGYASLIFFPNFFSSLVPENYIEATREQSLVPDGNLIRNVGGVYSYQIIVVGALAVASAVSFFLYYSSQSKSSEPVQEMPQIRKIMRMGILFFQLGFLPQLFFSFVQLIQPASIPPDHASFHTGNVVLAYLTIFGIPILVLAIFYHYHETYNSDVLEHYYSLRETSQMFLVYSQALLLCFAVGKPLLAMFLIVLEAMWLIYNFWLYRYGEGYSVSDTTKFWIVGSAVSLSYLFAALLETGTPWQLIVVILTLVGATGVIYSGYQLTGLYYGLLFRSFKGKQF